MSGDLAIRIRLGFGFAGALSAHGLLVFVTSLKEIFFLKVFIVIRINETIIVFIIVNIALLLAFIFVEMRTECHLVMFKSHPTIRYRGCIKCK